MTLQYRSPLEEHTAFVSTRCLRYLLSVLWFVIVSLLPVSHKKNKQVLAVFLLRLPCGPCCQLSHFVARHTPVFLGSHQLAGHELTARINLLPVKQPDASLEQNIDDIERKRTRDESKVFDQVGVDICFCTHCNLSSDAWAGGF